MVIAIIICSVVLVLALLTVLVFFLFSKTNYAKNRNIRGKQFKAMPNELELGIFGSGPGLYGFDEKQIRPDKNSFNFSYAPCSLEYSRKLLEQYLPRFKKNAIVVVVVCPLNFAKNKARENPNYGLRFVNVLGKERLPHYSGAQKIAYKYPFVRNPKLLKKIIKDDKEESYDVVDTLAEDKIPQATKSMIVGWCENASLNNLTDTIIDDDQQKTIEANVAILKDMVKICKDHGLHPFIVLPPVIDDLRNNISTDSANRLFMNPLKEIKDTPIIDYYSDTDFTDDMFHSVVFLNRSGRALLAKKLSKDIEENL